MPEGDVFRTEIAGIPTFVGPAIDGVHAGGLVFRVGHADETLATHGITHLTEHLALAFCDFTKVHAGGATSRNMTVFQSSGTLDEVVTFLNSVATSLAAMPLDRLETEKSILRTEESRRPWGPTPSLAAWRYGARGYGLSSFAELGLSRLTAADVEAWITRYFVRENAALWLATDRVPTGLDLELASGQRQRPPLVTSALPELPAWFQGHDGVIALESVVARGSAALVFASVLEQALYRELRREGGYSYTVTTDYEIRDAETAFFTAMADALPEKQDEAVRGFIDVLAALKAGRIPAEDFAAAVSKARTNLDHPDAVTHMLPGSAVNELLGCEQRSPSQLVDELDATSIDDLKAVAIEVYDNALVQTPTRSLEWAGFAAAPVSSEDSIEGRTARFVDDRASSIVAGRAGVMAAFSTGRSTVRWEDAVAIQAFPDGARTVYGGDGFQVHVEPTLLGSGKDRVMTTINAFAPEALILPQPARDAADIPQPQTSRAGVRLVDWAWLALALLLPVLAWHLTFGSNTRDLRVGQCLTDLTAEESVYDVPEVDCSAPHRAEVFAKFALPDGPHPGEEAVTNLSGAGCKARFKPFVGRDLGSSKLNQYFVYPTRASWESNREVTCLVFAYEDVTGTLKGANR